MHGAFRYRKRAGFRVSPAGGKLVGVAVVPRANGDNDLDWQTSTKASIDTQREISGLANRPEPPALEMGIALDRCARAARVLSSRRP